MWRHAASAGQPSGAARTVCCCRCFPRPGSRFHTCQRGAACCCGCSCAATHCPCMPIIWAQHSTHATVLPASTRLVRAAVVVSRPRGTRRWALEVGAGAPAAAVGALARARRRWLARRAGGVAPWGGNGCQCCCWGQGRWRDGAMGAVGSSEVPAATSRGLAAVLVGGRCSCIVAGSEWEAETTTPPNTPTGGCTNTHAICSSPRTLGSLLHQAHHALHSTGAGLKVGARCAGTPARARACLPPLPCAPVRARACMPRRTCACARCPRSSPPLAAARPPARPDGGGGRGGRCGAAAMWRGRGRPGQLVRAAPGAPRAARPRGLRRPARGRVHRDDV